MPGSSKSPASAESWDYKLYYYTQLSKYLTAYLHMVQNEYFTECLWTLKSYHC